MVRILFPLNEMIEVGFGGPHRQFSTELSGEDQRQPDFGDYVEVFVEDAAENVEDATIDASVAYAQNAAKEKVFYEKLYPRGAQRQVILWRVI